MSLLTRAKPGVLCGAGEGLVREGGLHLRALLLRRVIYSLVSRKGEGKILEGTIVTSLEAPSGHLGIPTREPDNNFLILHSDPPGMFLALLP